MEIQRSLQNLQTLSGQAAPSAEPTEKALEKASVKVPAQAQGEPVTLSPEAIRLYQAGIDGGATTMSGGGTTVPPWPPGGKS